jgi:hypothetical protein
MANSLTVGSITNNSAVLSLTALNDFGVTVYVYLLVREGNFSGNSTALENSSYIVKTFTLPAGTSIISSDPDANFTVTGLKANTTYSFQWSMSRQATLSSSTVDRRRPLSPPGTFTTLPNPPVFTNIDVPVNWHGWHVLLRQRNRKRHDKLLGYLGQPADRGNPQHLERQHHGTPSAAGTFTFNIRATGPGGTANTGNLSVTIAADVVAPAWVDNTLSGDLRVGIAYSDGVKPRGLLRPTR